MPTSRPGGRTARTRAAVFAAAEGLLQERGPAAISMADIAQAAGVASTSLYRRWGTVDALLLDVSMERLRTAKPIPNTGTLEGDLRAWGRAIARSLQNPARSSIFMVLVASVARMEASPERRSKALEPRVAQIREMLERASARGEKVPSQEDVRDFLLAPLYTRALFGGPLNEACVERFVSGLMNKSVAN